ncbi:MAG: hypothetical protein HYV97_03570 [Bdellovibrio sp.]|nr:hypothetical protein [Bdellovibrio sp.]
MEEVGRENKSDLGTGTGSGAGTKSGTRPGRKRQALAKNQQEDLGFKKEQTKFFVDVTHEKESLELILGLLGKANQKEHGRAITFKDLAIAGLAKLTDKDLERIQETTLTEMEKVNRALNEFNQKNSTSLSLGEFLVKRLGIN